MRRDLAWPNISDVDGDVFAVFSYLPAARPGRVLQSIADCDVESCSKPFNHMYYPIDKRNLDVWVGVDWFD